MERSSRSRSIWMPAALCLAMLPAIASAQANKDYDVPNWPWANQMTAVQTLNDLNLTPHQIASILPLITDLRDAEQKYSGEMANVYAETLVRNAKFKSDMPHEYTAEKAKEHFRNHREKIWSTISARIGADKANTLRGLVETQSHRVDPVLTERVQRIDTLLAQWDTQAKQRIAAYGGQPAVTITETQTTVTETAGFAHRSSAADMGMNLVYYTSPTISSADLHDLLQQRLLIMAYGPRVAENYWYTEHDLNSNDLMMLAHQRFGFWK